MQFQSRATLTVFGVEVTIITGGEKGKERHWSKKENRGAYVCDGDKHRNCHWCHARDFWSTEGRPCESEEAEKFAEWRGYMGTKDKLVNDLIGDA